MCKINIYSINFFCILKVVEEQVEIENQNKEPEVDVLQSTENLNDSVIFNTSSSHPKKKKKTDDDIMLDQAFSILTAAAKSVEETECGAYRKYIETKLQSFSPQTRNAVQHEFGNIIFKACQGFYEYNYPANNMNPLHMSLSNYNPSLYLLLTFLVPRLLHTILTLYLLLTVLVLRLLHTILALRLLLIILTLPLLIMPMILIKVKQNFKQLD